MSEPQDYDQLLAEVGESFRAVRERQGWTVEEFAAIAGLEISVITEIEAGEFALDKETLGLMLHTVGTATSRPGVQVRRSATLGGIDGTEEAKTQKTQ